MDGEDGGTGRIERDRARFNAIVRGHIKHDLRRYVTGSEMIGRKGRHLVSIPVPRIELPRLRFGRNGRGKGQGESDRPGEEGQPGEGAAGGAAGGQAGQHLLEVELSLEEMAQILGEELELPNIEPRGRARLSSPSRKFASLRRTGPRSLRHMRRTWKEALKREIVTGQFDPTDPKIVPTADDLRFRQAGDALDLVRRPFRNFLADILNAIDALVDEFLVLPAVLENVPEQPIDRRDVHSGAHPNIFGCVRRGSRHARVDDD